MVMNRHLAAKAAAVRAGMRLLRAKTLVEVKNMRTRESKRRIAVVTAVLLIAVAAGGVITWQNFGKEKENQTASNEEDIRTVSEEISDGAVADLPEEDGADQTEETMEPDSQETSGTADGQMNVAEENTPAAQEEQPEDAQPASGEADPAAQAEETNAQVTLDFNEGTVLMTPVSGQVVIPYNMDNTVYFPTLNVYKCNPSVVISAEVGTQVAAVANSQVKSIVNDAQTGLTVTMDMGNGYEAVYGQLQDVTLEEGAMVQAGEIIGSIAEPTRYYTEEGSNLYFMLSKDGATLDPTMYLSLQAE